MRPLKMCIWHIPVRQWFPPDDALSGIMARLCILREDLFLELQGITAETIERLDDNGDGWRDTYFFRNSMRTLFEMRRALHLLKKNKDFLATIAKNPEFAKAFNDLNQRIEESYSIVETIRHEVAGHLKASAVQEGLQKIDPRTKQIFQAGNSPKNTHYKFVTEIIGATLLRNAGTNMESKWKEILTVTSEISLQAMHAIDALFWEYIKYKGVSTPL